MTKKVVPLRDDKPATALGIPNPDVIRDLRLMLEQAESGLVQGFVMAASRSDDQVTTVISTSGNHFAMSHAISALWFRFQQRMADDSRAEL